jgi:hypothetical protein
MTISGGYFQWLMILTLKRVVLFKVFVFGSRKIFNSILQWWEADECNIFVEQKISKKCKLEKKTASILRHPWNTFDFSNNTCLSCQLEFLEGKTVKLARTGWRYKEKDTSEWEGVLSAFGASVNKFILSARRELRELNWNGEPTAECNESFRFRRKSLLLLLGRHFLFGRSLCFAACKSGCCALKAIIKSLMEIHRT